MPKPPRPTQPVRTGAAATTAKKQLTTQAAATKARARKGAPEEPPPAAPAARVKRGRPVAEPSPAPPAPDPGAEGGYEVVRVFPDKSAVRWGAETYATPGDAEAVAQVARTDPAALANWAEVRVRPVGGEVAVEAAAGAPTKPATATGTDATSAPAPAAPSAPATPPSPGRILIPRAWIVPAHYHGGPSDGQRINPRTTFPEDHLAELEASIRARGIEEELRVRVPVGSLPPGEWTDEAHPLIELVDGECRWIAAGRIGLGELPCLVGVYSDEETHRYATIRGTLSRSLSTMDRARAHATEWERARGRGEKQAEVAAALGYGAQSTFSNFLRLLRLPASWQALVEDGVVSESAAKNHLLPFADLPEVSKESGEPIAAPFFEEVETALRGAAAEDTLADDRVRELVGSIGVRVSFPADQGQGFSQDRQPAFTRQRHDAADGCGCGAPTYLWARHAKVHARCFDLAWFIAENKRIRADLDAASAARLAEEREREERRKAEAPPAPAPAAEAPRAAPASSTSPASSPTPTPTKAAPAPPSEPEPVPEYRPGQVIPAGARRRYDPDLAWLPVGTVDAAGFAQVIDKEGLPDPALLPAESLRYVEGDRTGISIYTTDGAALGAGRAAMAEALSEAIDAQVRAFAEGLRKEAEGTDPKKGPGLAALLVGMGQVSAAWLPAAARAIGVLEGLPGDPRLQYAMLVDLKKGELEALASVAAHLSLHGQQARVYEYAKWARTEAERGLQRRAADALTVLLEACPPELDASQRGEHVFTRLDTALFQARAAVGRAGRAPAADLPEKLAALRSALAAARAFMEDGGAPPAGCDLSGTVLDAQRFVADHPGLPVEWDPGERLACLMNALRATLAAASESYRARDGAALQPLYATLQRYADDAGKEIEAAGLPQVCAERQLLNQTLVFLSSTRGEAETLFGGVAPVEEVGEERGEEEEDGPAQKHLAHLIAAVRRDTAAVETLGMDTATEKAALTRLTASCADLRNFAMANGLVSEAADALDGAGMAMRAAREAA